MISGFSSSVSFGRFSMMASDISSSDPVDRAEPRWWLLDLSSSHGLIARLQFASTLLTTDPPLWVLQIRWHIHPHRVIPSRNDETITLEQFLPDVICAPSTSSIPLLNFSDTQLLHKWKCSDSFYISLHLIQDKNSIFHWDHNHDQLHDFLFSETSVPKLHL